MNLSVHKSTSEFVLNDNEFNELMIGYGTR